ncbi:MAG: hypothetical protein IKQ60_04850 [Candidatus Methanomethylophilaceae archaeon]|nr:hypothetical protein [Candidatus Methanomethylophilaceae archaeon]
MSRDVLEWNEEQQPKLNGILRRLSEIELLDSDGEGYNDKIDAIVIEIKDLYNMRFQEFQFRHQYSSLASLMIDLQEESCDDLMRNLKSVIERCDDNGVCMKLLKLKDHLSLEIIRKSIKIETEASIKSLNESNKTLNELDNKTSALEETI